MQNRQPEPVRLFFVVTALYWASVYTYSSTLSPYLQSMGVSYTMIGLIGSSYGFTQMVLRIPLGILSDKLGKRKLFVIGGVSVAALSSLVLYAAPNALWMLLGRGLAGVAASAWVVFTVLFSSYFEKGKAASRISTLTVFNNGGQVLAMLAGGLAANYLGERFPFLLGALIGLAAILLSFGIRENVPERKQPPRIRDLLGVAQNRNLMVMAGLAVISQAIQFGTMNTFTPSIATALGANAATRGLLTTIGNIPRVLSAILCSILFSRKVDLRKLLALSFALLAISSLATPWAPNLTLLYLLVILGGFGSGISMTALLSLCTRDIEDTRRSAAMGFFQAIYGIGMFLGPMVVGAVADQWGMSVGYGLAALTALIGVWISFTKVEQRTL